jgi:hypothetical protein
MMLLVGALVFSSVPMPAEAEGPRFREYFEKGESLYGQGEYGMAVHFFRLADSRRVTPEVAYDLAKCFEKLNDHALVVYYYRLYLRRAPAATDTVAVAEKVGKLLGKLASAGRGFVEVEAPRGKDLRISQRAFPEGPGALFLPEGEHEVTAEFPGGRQTTTVLVQSGRVTSATFEPVSPPLLVAGLPLSAQPAAAVGAQVGAAWPSPVRLGAYGALGVGIASVTVGAIVGAMSASQGADVTNNKALTVSQARALAADANMKGLAANVLFAVGAAGAAAGGVLFVFSMPEPGMARAAGSAE